MYAPGELYKAYVYLSFSYIVYFPFNYFLSLKTTEQNSLFIWHFLIFSYNIHLIIVSESIIWSCTADHWIYMETMFL